MRRNISVKLKVHSYSMYNQRTLRVVISNNSTEQFPANIYQCAKTTARGDLISIQFLVK